MTVADALIELITTLELATDDQIDLDFEVSIMESLGCMLQRLGAEERDDFLEHVERRAAAARDPSRAEIIRLIPEGLGILSTS